MVKYRRIYIGSSTVGITLISLFLYMTFLGATIISDGDKVCAGTIEDPCVSLINITVPITFYIYNKEGIDLDFSPNIENYKLYLRDKRYTRTCIEDICGWRLFEMKEKKEGFQYAYKFYPNKVYEFALVGYKKNPDDVIKWSLGAANEELDPIWLAPSKDKLSNVLKVSLRSSEGWEITATGAEENLNVEYEIIGENATKFCIEFKDKKKYEGALSLSAKDIRQVPITKIDSKDSSFFLEKETIDISNADKEKQCFTITYDEFKEGMEFKIGWNSITISSDLSYGRSNTASFSDHIFYDPINKRWHVVYVDDGDDVHTQSSSDKVNWVDGTIDISGNMDYDEFDCELDVYDGNTYLHCVYGKSWYDGFSIRRCALTGSSPFITCGLAHSAFKSASMAGGDVNDEIESMSITLDSDRCSLIAFGMEDDSIADSGEEWQVMLIKERNYGDSGCGDGDFYGGYEFTPNAVVKVVNAEIDTNKFVTCWVNQSQGNPYAGYCNVGTLSGTTITYGDPFMFDNDCYHDPGYSVIGIAKLDTNKFAVAFSDLGAAPGYVIAGNVSGTDITFGTRVRFGDSATDSEYIAMDGIDVDKVAIVSNDEANSNTGKAIVCNTGSGIDDLTFSCGSEVDLVTGKIGTHPIWTSVAKIDTDKFITCYGDAVNGNGICVSGTVSGTTITMGTPSNFSNGENVIYTKVSSPDTDKFVLSYTDTVASADDGELLVGNVSGTTIAYGSPSVIGSINLYQMNHIGIDSTHFALVHYDGSLVPVDYYSVDWTANTFAKMETLPVDDGIIGGGSDFGLDITKVSMNMSVVCLQNDYENDQGECSAVNFSDAEFPVKPLYNIQEEAGYGRPLSLGIRSFGDLDAQIFWDIDSNFRTVFFDGDTNTIGTQVLLNDSTKQYSTYGSNDAVVIGDSTISFARDSPTSNVQAYVTSSKDGNMSSYIDTGLDQYYAAGIQYSGFITAAVDTRASGGDDIYLFVTDDDDPNDIYYAQSTDGGVSWETPVLWMDDVGNFDARYLSSYFDNTSCDIMVRWVVNNTVDGLYSVMVNNLTTDSCEVSDTCTYSGSGNWIVDGSDNCVITEKVTGDGSDMSIDGTGTFTAEAEIIGFGTYTTKGACVVRGKIT